MRKLALPLLAAALASCAPAPEPADCTVVDNGDGTRTLTCPDGTTATFAGGGDTACTLTLELDGTRTIACADGTTIRLDPDGRPIFPAAGTLVGTARAVGRDARDGIRVRAEGPISVEAVTGEDGAYTLEVPAGIYRLVFELEGWATETLPNQPAVGGPWEVAPVVLRRGATIGPPGSFPTLSPARDALLLAEPDGGHSIVRPGSEPVRLTSRGFHTQFTPATSAVLVFQESEFATRVVWHDPDGADQGVVSSVAGSVSALPSGDAVLVGEFPPDGGQRLVLWERATRAAHVLSEQGGGGQQFSSDGRHVTWQDFQGRFFVHDRETSRTSELALPEGSFAGGTTFAGPAHLVVFFFPPAGGFGAIAVDLATQESSLLVENAGQVFTTRRGQVVYQSGDGAEIRLVDLVAGTESVLVEDAQPVALQLFSERALHVRRNGLVDVENALVDLDTGLEVPLPTGFLNVLGTTPDGSIFLWLSDGSLLAQPLEGGPPVLLAAQFGFQQFSLAPGLVLFDVAGELQGYRAGWAGPRPLLPRVGGRALPVRFLAPAPDGGATIASTTRAVWLVDEQGEATELGLGEVHGVEWSPDGARALVRSCARCTSPDLVLVDAATRGATLVDENVSFSVLGDGFAAYVRSDDSLPRLVDLP